MEGLRHLVRATHSSARGSQAVAEADGPLQGNPYVNRSSTSPSTDAA